MGAASRFAGPDGRLTESDRASDSEVDRRSGAATHTMGEATSNEAANEGWVVKSCLRQCRKCEGERLGVLRTQLPAARCVHNDRKTACTAGF